VAFFEYIKTLKIYFIKGDLFMLKKCAIKKIIISSMALVIVFLISLFPSNQNLAIEKEIIYVDSISMPIYALDQNQYVARTSVVKPSEDEVKYIIEALTENSNISNYLASGFFALIPQNTKLLDYSLTDGLLKLNFSKEFLNVSLENEEKMLEAIIYSLCELESIKKIMIFVEGNNLLKLPNSQKSIPNILDKSFGINKIYSFNDIKNTSKTTIYYLSNIENNYYYVPITKVSNENTEKVEIIVNELKSNPIYETNLISYLNASYELKDYEILENSITLSFNNLLLAHLNDDEIIEEVKYSLALSLRDTYDIEKIMINLD